MSHPDESSSVSPTRSPALGICLLLIALCVSIIGYGILVLKAAPHIPLLLCGAMAAAVARIYGHTWTDVERSAIKAIMQGFSAILILMVVGIVIGSWLLSGTVPAMITYGLMIFSPDTFLIVTVLICAVVSVSTGSAWTTIGTIGIAIVGIAEGLQVPLPITVGAIVSGAFFGDKMSPLSDTTNLAPAVTGAKLFDHIGHMMYTVTPSLILSLVLFGFIGFRYSGADVDQTRIDLLLNGIQDAFYIGPILLLPPLAVMVLAIMKKPALPTLLFGAFLGIGLALIFQGATLAESVTAMDTGYSANTGLKTVDDLLTRGGLQRMLWSVSLIIIALGFGGILDKMKVLDVIVGKMTRFIKSTGSLVLCTVLTCLSVNILMAEQYLSILLPGRMYAKSYEKLGLKPKNLSRVLEDSGTLFNPLIPWGLSGSFVHATLNVSAFEYLPFAFLCLINPIISVIYGFTGFTMEKFTDNPEEAQGPS